MSIDRHKNMNVSGFAIHVFEALEKNLRNKDDMKVILENDEIRNLVTEFTEKLESVIDSELLVEDPDYSDYDWAYYVNKY